MSDAWGEFISMIVVGLLIILGITLVFAGMATVSVIASVVEFKSKVATLKDSFDANQVKELIRMIKG